MPEHINHITMVLGLAILLVVKSIVLTTFLWIMIQIQKFRYDWLPLIGSAVLASFLDMFPFVGHYLALPTLYFCIWKITRASMFPEAVFTVVLSYACMFTVSIILMAYLTAPGSHFTANAKDNDSFDSDTNFQAIVAEQTSVAPSTNQMAHTTSVPKSTLATGISIQGFSGGANAMVTIRYDSKNYIISLGDGVSIPTDQGLASVHFVEAGKDDVTLTVNGQKVKYAVK